MGPVALWVCKTAIIMKSTSLAICVLFKRCTKRIIVHTVHGYVVSFHCLLLNLQLVVDRWSTITLTKCCRLKRFTSILLAFHIFQLKIKFKPTWCPIIMRLVFFFFSFFSFVFLVLIFSQKKNHHNKNKTQIIECWVAKNRKLVRMPCTTKYTYIRENLYIYIYIQKKD